MITMPTAADIADALTSFGIAFDLPKVMPFVDEHAYVDVLVEHMRAASRAARSLVRLEPPTDPIALYGVLDALDALAVPYTREAVVAVKSAADIFRSAELSADRADAAIIRGIRDHVVAAFLRDLPTPPCLLDALVFGDVGGDAWEELDGDEIIERAAELDGGDGGDLDALIWNVLADLDPVDYDEDEDAELVPCGELTAHIYVRRKLKGAPYPRTRYYRWA